MKRLSVTTRLRTWEQLSNRPWPTLLLGNGSSVNIWPGFGYSQLFQHAEFDAAAQQLFRDLQTTNFETVLEGLWHAERVLSALNRRRSDVERLYEQVRSQLVTAVRSVHIPWDQVPRTTFSRIAETLDGHERVFTLNYDLLTYWATMENTETTLIGDYFWGHHNTFDPTNAELTSERTGLLFLHGEVHLWQDSDTGQSGKWTVQGGRNLLSSLAANFLRILSRQPLFVSEGTSAQKMSVIRRSDYLSFARRELNDDTSDTVVFGASFGQRDDHIVQALRAGGRRRIAISLLPEEETRIVAAMGRYRAKLPDQDLVFFDSRTHPLGDPSLTVSS
jgi:Domain of unknown function (DUF4917)